MALQARLTITGRVQGVGYRETMRREAVRLGVRGWVRNRRDGSVEAAIDGDPQAVRDLITWAHNGPRGARVSGVRVSGLDAEMPGSFEIWATE